jgi:hypothetical protein
MPMPPHEPSAEGPRDRQVAQEIAQVTRALRTEGPADAAALEQRLASQFPEPGRFEKALQYAVADGLVVRDADGRYTAI